MSIHQTQHLVRPLGTHTASSLNHGSMQRVRMTALAMIGDIDNVYHHERGPQ